ncbi:unnamed protein product [marine sediment metagenome]|uniref:Uncharacterized protein n=1 Tax=marine sediment metagenome TaxID=412755 RepID=X1V838_9ZZZZ
MLWFTADRTTTCGILALVIESALSVLAVASSAFFGVVGVLLGLFMGVRLVSRDEERYGTVALGLEKMGADMSRLRIEWASTLEQIEALAGAVETRRRRATAAESANARKEIEKAEEAIRPPMSRTEERNEIRKRVHLLGRE